MSDTNQPRQVGGTHYEKMGIMPWEAIDVWLTPEQAKGYYVGTAIAYLGRINAEGDGKGGVQDIEKAIHTLQKYVDMAKNDTPLARWRNSVSL